MTSPVDHVFLTRLRRLGHVEGVSTLVLFGVAMPLKYGFDMPMAVTIVGSIHGLLFVALVAALVVAIERVPIGWRLALAGALGAVVPFGPFVVDRWLARVGR
jgi:integral membrane protein